jgi:putative peptide zinc metalloprotease protein
VLLLAKKYLFIGVALGLWAVTMQLLLPLYRALKFLATGPMLAGRRMRAVSVSGLMLLLMVSVLMGLPVRQTTQAEGVVWVPDQARLYAGVAGFVTEVLVPSGTDVAAGTALIQMHSPSLNAAVARLEARRRELEIQSAAEQLEERVQSQITREELHAVEAELALLREEQSLLQLRSTVSGTFVLPEEANFNGRYLQQGDVVGYIVNADQLIVRTAISQADIGLIRQQVTEVEVRLAEQMDQSVQARMIRETPAASTTLPDRALGTAGGGAIAIRTTEKDGLTAAEKIFEVDLGLPEKLLVAGVGERAYVRFHHGAEPLASQWLRSGRRLLLSRLSI